MDYLRLSLVTTLGGRSARPLRMALIKFAALMLGLFGLTYLIMPAIKTLPISSAMPQIWWLAIIGVSIQLVSAVLMLTSQSILPSRVSSIALIHTLPLARLRRWALVHAPSIMLGILVVTMVIQPVLMITQKASIPAHLGVIAVIVAVLSGIGIANYRPVNFIAARLGPFGLIAVTEILVVRKLFSYYLAGVEPPSHWYVSMLLLLAIPLIWLIVSIFKLELDSRNQNSKTTSVVPIPTVKFWHLAKYLRTRKSLFSLLLSFVICCTLAWVVYRNKLSGASLQAVLFASAVFASTLATDIRSSVRRILPPDIFALYGSNYFVRKQLITAIVIGVVATLPVGISLVINDSVLSFLNFGAMIIFSSMVGLAISEVLASGLRDITGQVLGAALCLIMLLQLPRLIPGVSVTLRYVVLSVALAIVSLVIEKNRNNFIWRKHVISK